MCGIFCSILYNQSAFLNQFVRKGSFKESNSQFVECFEALQQRGPDSYQEFLAEVSACTVLQCAASVLWMQGTQPISQPLCDEDGNVLLWNGDIFNGPLATDGNDTSVLSEKLLEASREGLNIPEVLTQVRGPYSFIYYHKNGKRLYFARDVIGRHSLLIGYAQRYITLTSVASRKLEGFMEVPAIGVFEFNLEKDGDVSAVLYRWSHVPEAALNDLKILPEQLQEKLQMGEVLETYILVPSRRNKIPTRVELEMWSMSESNVSVSQLMDKLSSCDLKTRVQKTMLALSEKPSSQVLIEDLINTLKLSIRLRVEKCPKLCKACAKIFVNEKELKTPCDHTKVAVLFSGGIDSSVLAALVDSFVPIHEPIDLLNVAFQRNNENSDAKLSKGSQRACKHEEDSVYKVPDRITGLNTLLELRELNPKRKWNFVQIDVSEEELKKEREKIIADLIYPLNTVMDESLGCALWFASRGQGIIHDTNEAYTTPARIVLSGIGADEQLGGYMRHRTTLKHRGGWEALDRELQMELRRISRRNLGRDDRIVSSHGRQCRMPFLDEDLINYLNFIPPWYKCFPVESMPPGVGDKLLLRLAAWKLGLRNACNLPKRAMQFGSRIAHSKENGDAISERL